jgi:hypothetical protein
MDFWILMTNSITPYKIHGYGLLSYNEIVSCVWNFEILNELCLKNYKSIKWMECDFNLSCYGLFKILKTTIILKNFFYDFFICLITSWFEIGNGKKMSLSI